MAIGWFIVNMLTRTHPTFGRVRYCGMDDMTSIIHADGGDWAETEVLGNVALVRVRASDATLATVQSSAGILRILSKINLTDTMTDVTTAQRTAVQNKLLNMGYTQAEINAALGTNLTQWRSHKFGDLLRLICAKRLKPLSIDANGNVTFSALVVTPDPPDKLVQRIP